MQVLARAILQKGQFVFKVTGAGHGGYKLAFWQNLCARTDLLNFCPGRN